MIQKRPPFKTKDNRLLVYFQGLYLTEEEKEILIQRDLELNKRCQSALDQVAGARNATDSQVVLSLFKEYKKVLNSEIESAKEHLIFLKKNMNTEVFDKENLLNTSILVKRLLTRLSTIKDKVEQMYYALGTPIIQVTEGKEIKKYQNELIKLISNYAKMGILMNRVHHKLHNKKKRG